MCANLVVEIYVIEGRVYDGLNKLTYSMHTLAYLKVCWCIAILLVNGENDVQFSGVLMDQ